MTRCQAGYATALRNQAYLLQGTAELGAGIFCSSLAALLLFGCCTSAGSILRGAVWADKDWHAHAIAETVQGRVESVWDSPAGLQMSESALSFT